MSGPADSLFDAERPHLFAVAYRMLGSVSDAEDIVQDVFERWLALDTTDVDNPAAYLTTMTTRRSIDALRAARRDREVYVGPWLPEPLITAPSPADIVELDESLTIGFLFLLEQLSATERAVHLLHEVFGFSFGEIAPMVDKTEANCRQIARRARAKLAARTPAQTNQGSPLGSAEEQAMVDGLIAAVLGGDMDAVAATLTDDAVLISDGGASMRAARHPVVGSERIARFITNLTTRLVSFEDDTLQITLSRVNQQPAVLVSSAIPEVGASLFVFEASTAGIRRVHVLRNPEKLAHFVGSATQLAEEA